MRRNIFILLFLFCFSMTAQNLEKIETLHKQFDKALKTDFELALLIAESSVKLSEEYGDKSLIIKSYLNLSDIYVHQRNKKKEIENYTNKALELAKEIKDEETITKIYLRLGTIHSTNNSFKKALELYQKAQKRIDSLKHGYILKETGYEELISTIRNIVLEDKKYLDVNTKKENSLEFKKNILTNREKEIVKLIANENTTDEIADILFLSKHTVETHKKNIFQKLNVSNAAGLIKKSFYLGYIE